MICYLHPHLTNMSIWNTIINIITFREIVTFKHQKARQFHHLLHLLLYQQITKDVPYLAQYMRISFQFYLKLDQELLGVQVM